MLKIGLTGGIGSGKSTVLNLFKQLGVDVFDADTIAKELTQPHTEYTQKIINHFGDSILLNHDEIDRNQLGIIIFNDPKEKAWLNALLHPIIWQTLQDKTAASTTPYCVTAVPLLAESNNPYGFDRICVIDIDQPKQIERSMNRDNKTAEQIKPIIHAQATNQERLNIADDIINNNGNHIKLKNQILKLHKKYLSLLK